MGNGFIKSKFKFSFSTKSDCCWSEFVKFCFICRESFLQVKSSAGTPTWPGRGKSTDLLKILPSSDQFCSDQIFESLKIIFQDFFGKNIY